MNAHERSIELGAARFDFALSAGERRDLDAHLAGCAPCRWQVSGMADDARRVEARPARRMPPQRAAALRARLERPRRGPSPAMVLVAAVLLVTAGIAALAVGAYVRQLLDPTRLAVEPVPSAVAVTPAPFAPAVAPTSWTLTALGTTPGVPFQAAAVADSGDRWIAVGTRSCVRSGEWTFDCVAPVAVSADGRSWSTSGSFPIASGYSPPTSGPEAGIVDVAAGPGSFVAIGFTTDDVAERADGMPVMSRPGGAAWWSADGLSWERTLLEDGARPSTVFRGPDRWLIGGVVYRGADVRGDRPIGAVWTSTDGRAWTRIEDDAAFDVGGYLDTMEDPAAGGIGSFAWNGAVIVAGGSVLAEGGQPSTAAMWVSADGATWDRVADLPAGDAVVGLADADGTFVAAVRRCGSVSGCRTVLFRSGDGRAWETVPGDLPETAVMAAADGSVVVVTTRPGDGDAEEALDVRVSADGAAWTLLGSVARPDRTNWDGPVLVRRAGGVLDLLVRFDPVTLQDTPGDEYTLGYRVVPQR